MSQSRSKKGLKKLLKKAKKKRKEGKKDSGFVEDKTIPNFELTEEQREKLRRESQHNFRF